MAHFSIKVFIFAKLYTLPYRAVIKKIVLFYYMSN